MKRIAVSALASALIAAAAAPSLPTRTMAMVAYDSRYDKARHTIRAITIATTATTYGDPRYATPLCGCHFAQRSARSSARSPIYARRNGAY